MTTEDPLLCWPTTPAPELVRTIEIAGFGWATVQSRIEVGESRWMGAVIDLSADLQDALDFARAVRDEPDTSVPVLFLVGGAQIGDLAEHHSLFDDFCVTPFHPVELEARLRRLLHRRRHDTTGPVPASPSDLDDPEIVRYGPLVLNVETYQATVDGEPLDLTYMEYELLKFLAQSPGRVFTRESLLSQVWGYDYFGGARTVDVHVRRLRAKLGEQHATLISTVRSVGYRLGESRWG
ncbi:MAG: response regulator transcription factor [Microthrixaceae bacterium]